MQSIKNGCVDEAEQSESKPKRFCPELENHTEEEVPPGGEQEEETSVKDRDRVMVLLDEISKVYVVRLAALPKTVV